MTLNTTMSENDLWIYESPDGGETVYRRLTGGLQRELVSGDPDKANRLLERKLLWSKMSSQCQDDPDLKQLMDAAEVYYRLKYESA